MLKMTIIGSQSHVSSQVLDEVCHCLVNVLLWQLFPDGLQSSFQLISYLRVSMEFMVLFQHDPRLGIAIPGYGIPESRDPGNFPIPKSRD